MHEDKTKDKHIEEICTRHDIKKQLYDLSDDIRRIADDYADGKPVDKSAVALINLKLSSLAKVVTGRWFSEQLQAFPTRQNGVSNWAEKVRKDLEEKGIARIDSGNVN